MEIIDLIIEKGNDGILWGRVEYDGNLLVHSAPTEEELVTQMKVSMFDFHVLLPEDVQFAIKYETILFNLSFYN